MRLNRSSSTFANVPINSVFARPGTPTIKLLPPTNNVSSTSSMTSFCPTICFCSSAMMALRPPFILSASATSSADSSPDASRFSSKAALPHPHLVSHSVHDVIDAQFVGLIRFVNRPETSRREFPEVRNIGAVVDDHHQPLLRIVVLEHTKELRLVAVVRLRNDVERLDFEKRIEDDRR